VALRETTTGGGQASQVDYTWGNDLLSQTRIRGRGGWQAFLPDGLGSIRAIADSHGRIIDTLNYDAFGNDLTPTAQRPTNYGFAGEPTDPSTGLSFLRARYYDPTIGRFTARDDLIQGGPGTQGFNRYAYVEDNPVNATDPSGHFLDTILDVASVGYDAYRLATDGKKGLKTNLLALGADVAGTAIPFATGLGAAVRAGSKGEKALDAAKTLRPKGGSAGGPGAGKRFSQKTKDAERAASGNQCRYCGAQTSDKPGPNRSEGDHAVPKSKGGNNSPGNINNSCRTCNRKKGTKSVKDFLSSLFG
jgi:RHS repeat-associated protein